MGQDDDGEKVFLYVYDLSQGIARKLSTTFLGSSIEGVWHTGIGLYGKEYFFGPCIHRVAIGRSPFGTPREVLELGTTHVSKEVFEEFLQGIASRYSVFTYSLLNRNCNNFTDEAAHFLVGTGIPPHILTQADTTFDKFPLGATVSAGMHAALWRGPGNEFSFDSVIAMAKPFASTWVNVQRVSGSSSSKQLIEKGETRKVVEG